MKRHLELTNLAEKYLNFAINNPEYFNGVNWSTIQYSNISILQSHAEISRNIVDFLSPFASSGKSFLNLGMGPGFLENYVSFRNNWNFESCEWEQQDKNFDLIRDHLGIQERLNYFMNSIYDDDFEIFDCNKKYDYIIAIRFFPLNGENSSLDEIKQILKKLSKYGDKLILFDRFDNRYRSNLLRFYNSISSYKEYQNLDKLDISHYILDLTIV